MPKQSLLETSAIPGPANSYDPDDVLRGARKIADYIGEPERRTNYLLERGMLPAYQIGRLWHMSKKTHEAFRARLEDTAVARAEIAIVARSKTAT
jgi:hypothetical protein